MLSAQHAAFSQNWWSVRVAELLSVNNGTRIGGASLDVLAVEPPMGDNPLPTAKDCYITPHIAWATRAARSRLMDTAMNSVRVFLAGTVQNAVN